MPTQIDFRIVGLQVVPKVGYSVEAKRLYCSGSDGKYVGKDGIEMFIRGDYAIADARAGMVGYVQSDTVTRWAKKLEKKLTKHMSRMATTGPTWVPVSFSKGPMVCFRSEHPRDSGNPITLIHVLFDFTFKPS